MTTTDVISPPPTIKTLPELYAGLQALKQTEAICLKKHQDILADISKTTRDLEELSQTTDLLRELTNILITREIKPIQDFVTFGLKNVFPDRDLEFSIKRKDSGTGNTTYEFWLKDGEIEAPINNNFGGSVLEVCSLMLRLIVIKRLKKAHFLAMDEFFTGVDSRHRSNLIQLLKTLCAKGDFNIFLITHQEDFAAGADNVLHAYRTKDGLKIKQVSTRGGSTAQQPDNSGSELLQIQAHIDKVKIVDPNTAIDNRTLNPADSTSK